ncbi:MAG: glucose-6-phosphate isomerase [Acidobacteria bacterium]|nr:glucose-6-phosphate isomerase [Acidobacteriota bacterium]
MTILDAAVRATLARLDREKFTRRLWSRDPGLWKKEPDHQRIIRNSLGWLDSPVQMLNQVPELIDFANEVRAQGFRHAVVLGMGGSSLCPEVCRLTFGSAEGYLELHVLDSTVPASVARVTKEIDVPRTLFLVSSKSGGTIEPLSFYKHFYDLGRKHKGVAAGENFVAITDPGTGLEKLAHEHGFRRVFPGRPDIGGRFSALSNFGMVPAALAGVEISTLLTRALKMAQACSADVPVPENPGVALGAYLAEAALAGRDKITFIMSAGTFSFGDWVEQLIAESTGKEGKGLVPVIREYIGDPDVYGQDRVFVRMALIEEKKRMVENRLEALEAAGHPVLRIDLRDHYDLGREFFRWEMATATAGALLGINSFDQPNVQESKDITNRLLAGFSTAGKLPEPEPVGEFEGIKVYCDLDKTPSNAGLSSTPLQECTECVAAFLKRAKPGSYIALLPYIEPESAHKASIQALRLHLRDGMKLATTVGYGPRYLHSTGQLHKGGAARGLFVLITAEDKQDQSVPGEPYSFSVLKMAQALGDYEALRSRGRPVIRFHLSARVPGGLDQVTTLFKSAVDKVLGWIG